MNLSKPVSVQGTAIGGKKVFSENLEFTEEIIFTVFADLHYYQDRYISSVEDLKIILERAKRSGSHFVIHAGDLCNDYIGSPELIKTYLEQELPVYGVCGNHETEGVGNSRRLVVPCLTNREVIWGTEDGKAKEDGSVAYYHFDVKDFRVIATDNNYYFNGEEWLTYGEGKICPDAEFIDSCGSLGKEQLIWLEAVIADAARMGKKCMVVSHATFNTNWGAHSPDADAVQKIYEKYKGTVILSVNGHYHTNRAELRDNILYLDINTVRNGYVDFSKDYEQYAGYTATKTYYDDKGNVTETKSGTVHGLNWLAKNTWFFEQPLSTTVTVSLKTGEITVENMQTQWLHGVKAPGANNIVIPEITGGVFKLDK